MNRMNDQIFDELEDWDEIPGIRNMPHRKAGPGKLRTEKKGKKTAQDVKQFVAMQSEASQTFDFSYHASRHEHEWITNSLGGFYDMHWLDDVLRLLKGGKEANVYQCLANESVEGLDQPYLAAKVYRPRRFRNLKNDQMYRENRAHIDGDGRYIIDDGMLHAIRKRTAFGLELLHTSWIEHEVKTMQILAEAGCDVPLVHASGNNAILMTYLGDEHMPAPTLNSIDLDPDEAQPLYERVLSNVEKMLSVQRVHGDLSAYNILYWEGEITLIDFPQAIDPNQNSNAYRIFERDLLRVCEYFHHQGVATRPHQLAAELWTAFGHRLAPDVDPRLLDDQDDADRAFWEKMKNAGR